MSEGVPMQLPELSKQAINGAVLRGALQHPAVVYPAAAGLLGGIGIALLASSPWLIATAVAGGAVALAAAGVNTVLRRQFFAGRYIESAHRAIQAYRDATLAHLEQELKQSGSREGSGQLLRFREKIEAFEAVLGEKLEKREITYGRFLGIAEQVYLSGVDNLRGIVLALKGAEAIDEKYIHQRIGALERGGAGSGARGRELTSLKQQLDLRSEQLRRIEACLAQNEQAMAQLDAALAAIAEMKTGSRQASVDMETAMNELQQIAKRVGDYASPGT